jgi:cyclopropane fatty-acyl-phospholipid synthase-like methyltransferase
MLPDLKGKRVLDLGCGFGWHCRYAVEQGAKSVIGIDISERMLNEARKKTESPLDWIFKS